MKKLLALLLSVVLLICSVNGTFTVFAETIDATEHFENTDNWHLEKIASNVVNLGEGVPSGWSSWATVTADTTNVYGEGSTASIAVSCNYHAGWLDFPDLKANRNYTLTFNYKAPNGLSGSGSTAYAFQSIGIYSPTVGGESADVKITGSGDVAGNNGFFVRKSYTGQSSFTSVDGTVANAVAGTTSHVANSYDDWHTMTLTFNSGNLNDFIMLFTFGSATPVYMDNFSLVAEDYFETESNWRVDAYTNAPATATIGYKDAFANAKVTRSTAFAAEGREVAMKVYTPSQFTSIMLPDIKEDTNYTLSFEYYADIISGNQIFERIGIYAPDVEGANFAYQNKGFIFDILSSGGYKTDDFENYEPTTQNTIVTEAKKWHTVTITFNSGKLGRLALFFVSKVDTNNVAYIDNVSLVADEVPNHFETLSNWQLEKITSNVVNIGTGVPSNWSSWAKVVANKNYKYGEGSTSSVSVSCNYHAGWLDLPDLEKDTDYTLTFNYTAPNGLEGNTLKSAFGSIGIYSPTVGGNAANVALSGETFNPVDGFFVRKSTTKQSSYVSVDGTAANAIQSNNSVHVANENDVWHTMTLEFNSNEYNDFIMLFTFNSVTPVYMDNFTLTAKEKPDHFETEANWRVDAYTSDPANATIGYKDAFANAKVTRTDAFAAEGRDVAMKVFTPSQFTSIMLPELEANYDYTLSFSYMADNITSGAVFQRLGIYAPDVEGANFQYQNKGFIFDILTSGGYTTNDFENYFGTSQNTAATEANKWYDITINFNSGDLGRLALVFVSAVDTEHFAYVDDFVLTKGEFDITSSENFITGKELIENKLTATQGVVDISKTSAVLEYSATGLEFIANCEGAVKMSVSPIITNEDLRLALHINGERQDDIILTNSTTQVVLADNLEKGEYTFKIEKMGEAQIGRILINGIVVEGEIKTPAAQPEKYIDFYGDSITAGWGTSYYSGNPTNPFQYMDGSVTYAAVASKILGADFSAFGYSGWGITVSGANDGKGDKNMTTIYPDLPKNTDADYVVINLGTNDASKYVSAGLTEQQVKDAYLDFAKNIRKDYGADTTIIFAYGMMTDKANGFIDYAVSGMKALGDTNIYSVELPKGTSGGAGHPNAVEQAAAGEALADFIKEISKKISNVIGFKGNSIRKQTEELPQGLRFKFFMDKDYKTLYSKQGYTAVEIGVLALPEAYIGDNELLIGGVYTYNQKEYTPVTGLVTEDNLQYDENDADNVYFTAALVNIGKKGTSKIDYSAYSRNMVVRAYTVYEDENGNRITVYTEQQKASVFEVVYAILEDPQSDSDKEAAEAAIANCLDEYEAWVAKNHPA
ncbi:MAG: hypothetical protein E7551_06760 [Ruminococcaceae bacterium]|nr:hypothetical protein [Oscillospiraceae bacterium]